MQEIDADTDIEVAPENDGTAVMKNPKIVGVNISLQRLCVKCDAPLIDANTDFVKCLQLNDGKVCNTKQVFTNATSCFVGELEIKMDDEMKHFQIDPNALKQSFGKLSPDEIEDHLLLYHTESSTTGLIVKYVGNNIVDIKTYQKE